MKYILYVFIFIQSVYTQVKPEKAVDVTITFGHAPDCYGYSGICTFQTKKNVKVNTNKITRFNRYNNELRLVFNIDHLTDLNIKKLLSNKLTKGFYRYIINEDFELSKEVKNELQIIKYNKIKKGVYLIRLRDNQIIMKLKLE